MRLVNARGDRAPAGWSHQILGGRKAVIESPMVKELMAENTRETMRASLLEVLVGRFGPEARALRPTLRTIDDDKQLTELLNQSGKCPDLDSFRKLLQPGPRKRK